MKSVLALFYLCLLAAPYVLADGGGGGDNRGTIAGTLSEQERHNEDERELKVEFKDGGVEIESESKVNGARDRFRFRLRTNDDGAGLQIRLESESGDATYKNEQSLRVAFSQLITYSGGGFYDTTKTILSRYSLNTAWRQFTCNNGQPRYTCTAETADGVFKAVFDFAGTAFSAGDLKLNPSDLKITIYINYPYNGTATDDRVALLATGRTKAEYKDKTAGTKTKIHTGITAFTWLNYAFCDLANTTVGQSPVTFSTEGDDKVFGIYFSFDYNHPRAIVWDPTVSTNVYTGSAVTMLVNTLLLAVLAMFML